MFDFDDDKEAIDKAFQNMVKPVNDLYGVRDANYVGIVGFDTKGVKYCLAYKTSPKLILANRGAVARIAYEEFVKCGVKPNDDNEVKVRDVSNKKAVVKTARKKNSK